MDATDEDAIQTGGACRGGSPPAACRVLDLDFDGDYDSADETLFSALSQGYMLHPGRRFSSLDQPFGHQGLLYEPEALQAVQVSSIRSVLPHLPGPRAPGDEGRSSVADRLSICKSGSRRHGASWILVRFHLRQPVIY